MTAKINYLSREDLSKKKTMIMKFSRSPLIKSVHVIGSSSEIAKAICLSLAERGCRRFHLVSRDIPRCNLFASKLKEEFDSVVTMEETDLLDDSEIKNKKSINIDDFDLYLVTAGSLGDPILAQNESSEALKITAANYTGLITWITSIVTEERLQKSSRLWVFSSVASDRAKPSNYHYCAAKAALNIYCEGLYLRCYKKPFSVRIIKAGFLDTRMTEGKAPKLICLSPLLVAKFLLRRPNRRGFEYLPWWWSIIMRIFKSLPPFIASRL